ncbi:Secretory carrier-associated membrane protein 1 [Acipenser ruthenus]|uniref:Secretory carrier-associated membrane protein 1 n=1 Tax=Acipenser ruthenus TaxID=7906 RepID=A0A662YRA1_ACIRT|nr:Secretory carrier-associated membrane protein 1 [Acipenser ruthenus]
MSDFDSNPFADPDMSNPFQDPSVTQVTRSAPPGLEEYNPFTDGRTVHGLYRTTGASFEKAQQEFATGVMANKTVQTAAANAASGAARTAFKGEQI